MYQIYVISVGIIILKIYILYISIFKSQVVLHYIPSTLNSDLIITRSCYIPVYMLSLHYIISDLLTMFIDPIELGIKYTTDTARSAGNFIT